MNKAIGVRKKRGSCACAAPLIPSYTLGLKRAEQHHILFTMYPARPHERHSRTFGATCAGTPHFSSPAQAPPCTIQTPADLGDGHAGRNSNTIMEAQIRGCVEGKGATEPLPPSKQHDGENLNTMSCRCQGTMCTMPQSTSHATRAVTNSKELTLGSTIQHIARQCQSPLTVLTHRQHNLNHTTALRAGHPRTRLSLCTAAISAALDGRADPKHRQAVKKQNTPTESASTPYEAHPPDRSTRNN